MHAYALELLTDQLKEGNKALDVGSGSGYLTVCFAQMVGPAGKVVGIDHIKELVDWSESNVQKNHGDLLQNGRIKLVVGDGRQGYVQDGPYHAIHVGAAAPTLPQAVSYKFSTLQKYLRCFWLMKAPIETHQGLTFI